MRIMRNRIKFVFAIIGTHIYGFDLYNVDTAFSVRYELKNKEKMTAWKSRLLRDK